MFPRASVLAGQAARAFVPNTHIFLDPNAEQSSVPAGPSTVTQPQASGLDDTIEESNSAQPTEPTGATTRGCFVQAAALELSPTNVVLDRPLPPQSELTPPSSTTKLEWDYLVYVSVYHLLWLSRPC